MTNSILFNGHHITDFTMDETGRFSVSPHYYPPTTASAVRQVNELGVTDLLAYNSTSANDITESFTVSGFCLFGENIGEKIIMEIHIPNASQNDFENEMFASYHIKMIVGDSDEYTTGVDLYDWLQVKQYIAKYFVQEDDLHKLTTELMDELDSKYKIDSRLSLCEYYVQHKHKMSQEDKNRLSDLIEMF